MKDTEDKMMKRTTAAIILCVFILFLGCEKKIEKGLHEVHWDRDMCELCKMVVSDRKHTVQAVNPQNGKSYMFDDIGCTVLWFEEEKISWKHKANIFITDRKSGEFIDARKAHYDTNSRTPMDFGFAAYKNEDDLKGKEMINYEEVYLRILRGETMQNTQIKKANP